VTKNLTDLAIGNLRKPKAKGPRLIWDSAVPGLVLKLTPAGRKIWCLQARYPGGASELRTIRTIGTWPELKIESTPERPGARQIAQKWKAWIAANIDPADGEAEEQRQKEAERRAKALEVATQQANSFGKIAEAYIADKKSWRVRNRRIDQDAAAIRRDLIAEWSERPISSITPRDVSALIAKLKKGGFRGTNGKARKGSDRTAAAAWCNAEQVFKFAVTPRDGHDPVLDVSPCASLNKKMLFQGADLRPRTRVLDDDEIAAYWRGAGRLGYPMGAFYKLLLLTALRRNELAEAKWSEFHPELRRVLRNAAANEERVDWMRVDDKYKLLTIPAARFKSDAVHLVPLSNDACAVLETLPRFEGCDFLFTENAEKPVNGFSKAKARLDARMLRSLTALARMRGDDPESVILKPWVNHDTRRTVRSKLGDLKLGDPKDNRKVADHVSELILGHARQGLAGTYDRAAYIDDRREALEAWAAHVRGLTEPRPAAPTPREGGNVVQLRKAAR
jgi:integrase